MCTKFRKYDYGIMENLYLKADFKLYFIISTNKLRPLA